MRRIRHLGLTFFDALRESQLTNLSNSAELTRRDSVLWTRALEASRKTGAKNEREEMNMRRNLCLGTVAGFAAAACIILGAAPALAVPITYTETVTGTGSLNGVAFTNAAIVLSENGDTTNVIPPPVVFINLGTVTLSINGGSPVIFSDKTYVFDSQSGPLPTAGFTDDTISADILATDSFAFATYDLTTSIGPVTGFPGATFAPGLAFPTTGGAFVLNAIGTPIFTATVTPTTVPEPGSFGVCASALIGLGLLFRRRRRRQNSRCPQIAARPALQG